jgi:hypothetical protein
MNGGFVLYVATKKVGTTFWTLGSGISMYKQIFGAHQDARIKRNGMK